MALSAKQRKRRRGKRRAAKARDRAAAVQEPSTPATIAAGTALQKLERAYPEIGRYHRWLNEPMPLRQIPRTPRITAEERARRLAEEIAAADGRIVSQVHDELIVELPRMSSQNELARAQGFASIDYSELERATLAAAIAAGTALHQKLERVYPGHRVDPDELLHMHTDDLRPRCVRCNHTEPFHARVNTCPKFLVTLEEWRAEDVRRYVSDPVVLKFVAPSYMRRFTTYIAVTRIVGDAAEERGLDRRHAEANGIPDGVPDSRDDDLNIELAHAAYDFVGLDDPLPVGEPRHDGVHVPSASHWRTHPMLMTWDGGTFLHDRHLGARTTTAADIPWSRFTPTSARRLETDLRDAIKSATGDLAGQPAKTSTLAVISCAIERAAREVFQRHGVYEYHVQHIADGHHSVIWVPPSGINRAAILAKIVI